MGGAAVGSPLQRAPPSSGPGFPGFCGARPLLHQAFSGPPHWGSHWSVSRIFDFITFFLEGEVDCGFELMGLVLGNFWMFLRGKDLTFFEFWFPRVSALISYCNRLLLESGFLFCF